MTETMAAATPGREHHASPEQPPVHRVDGWQIAPVRTRWLGPWDTLRDAVRTYAPDLRPTDTLVISEKLAVLLTGRGLPIEDYAPRRVARLLVRFVRPRPGSRGLSVPEKMQYLVEHIGAPRLALACLTSAVTRPLGLRGMFYRVAGSLARDLDGGRPPFEHLLFPPLTRHEAQEICDDLTNVLGCGVAIVDINDYGGSIRAGSWLAPAPKTLMRLLRSNPLGQQDVRTPFAVLSHDDDPEVAS